MWRCPDTFSRSKCVQSSSCVLLTMSLCSLRDKRAHCDLSFLPSRIDSCYRVNCCILLRVTQLKWLHMNSTWSQLGADHHLGAYEKGGRKSLTLLIPAFNNVAKLQRLLKRQESDSKRHTGGLDYLALHGVYWICRRSDTDIQQYRGMFNQCKFWGLLPICEVYIPFWDPANRRIVLSVMSSSIRYVYVTLSLYDKHMSSKASSVSMFWP